MTKERELEVHQALCVAAKESSMYPGIEAFLRHRGFHCNGDALSNLTKAWNESCLPWAEFSVKDFTGQILGRMIDDDELWVVTSALSGVIS